MLGGSGRREEGANERLGRTAGPSVGKSLLRGNKMLMLTPPWKEENIFYTTLFILYDLTDSPFSRTFSSLRPYQQKQAVCRIATCK